MKVLFLIILLSSFSIRGAEDLAQIYRLAEDVRHITWKTKPLPQDFIYTTEESDLAQAYAQLDSEIASYTFGEKIQPEEPCAEKNQSTSQKKLARKIKNRRFNIYFTMTFSNQIELAKTKGFFGKDNYYHFMLAQGASGHEKAYQISTLSSLEAEYLRQEKDESWDKMNPKEKSDKLRQFAKEYSGIDIPPGMILSEYTINRMLENPNDWRNTLNKIKNDLSFEQKIRLASHFGGTFLSQNNNNQRSGTSKKVEEVVSLKKLLKSAKNNGSTNGSSQDVAFAQAQILTQLGISQDNVYIVSYATATGTHDTLAVQDPKVPNRVVKLNYSYIHESNNTSNSAALKQDAPLSKVGVDYKVYNVDGRSVDQIPSNVSQTLKKATNDQSGKNSIHSYQLQTVAIQTELGTGNAFTGQTSTGDKLIGVTLDKEMSLSHTIHKAGTVYLQREGDQTILTLDQQALYNRLNTSINTPELTTGNFQLQGELAIKQQFMVIQNRAEQKPMSLESPQVEAGNFNFQGSIGTQQELISTHSDSEKGEKKPVPKKKEFDYIDSYFVGMATRWSSPDRKIQIQSGLQADFYIDLENQGTGPSRGLKPVYNKTSWTTGVSREITGDMKFIGESSMVLREVGNTASFLTGIERSNTRFTAGYQAPLGSKSPSFTPKDQRAAILGVEKKWNNDSITFQLNYRKDLDRNKEGLFLSTGWKF